MNTHLIITLLVQLTWFSTDLETLQLRGDTYYEINSEKPFSGSVYKDYRTGETEMKGNLENGKKTGLWTEWYSNGQKKGEGIFRDGKEDGLEMYWYSDGQKSYERTYKDGERDGLFTSWSRNGQKEREETYKDGKLDGLFTSWFINRSTGYINYGQKKYEGTYKDGERDGSWKSYAPNEDGYWVMVYKKGSGMWDGYYADYNVSNESLMKYVKYSNGIKIK